MSLNLEFLIGKVSSTLSSENTIKSMFSCGYPQLSPLCNQVKNEYIIKLLTKVNYIHYTWVWIFPLIVLSRNVLPTHLQLFKAVTCQLEIRSALVTHITFMWIMSRHASLTHLEAHPQQLKAIMGNYVLEEINLI